MDFFQYFANIFSTVTGSAALVDGAGSSTPDVIVTPF